MNVQANEKVRVTSFLLRLHERKRGLEQSQRGKLGFTFVAQKALCSIFAILLLAPSLYAAPGWFDATFRRPIDVTWDAEHASGSEICYVEFYTGGHLNSDGSDLRVATDETRQVPAKILRVGPGDRVSLVFSLVKGVKKYYAYFGAAIPPPVKQGMDEVKIEAGLLLDMHEWTGLPVDNYQQVETAWEKAGPLIGRTMIDAPMYGINPFGTQERTISKITGSLFAPLEGDYTFAVVADDRGAFYIDANKVIFAVLGPADVRNQGKIHLKRGRHEFLFYHVNVGGDGPFVVAWQRPDARGWEPIPRGSVGIFSRGIPGALEELHKTLVADFNIQYGGESFYVDAYSHRYKFSAHEPKTAHATYEWDFGDGQLGAGAEIEHVYLMDGIYPVKLMARIGANNDATIHKLAVSRDWPHIEKPAGDEFTTQAKIIAAYDLAKMPLDWLPRATWLNERAGQIAPTLLAAGRIAGLAKHPNPDEAFAALLGASTAALSKGDTPGALKLWDAVASSSDLQPRAAGAYGQLLLWQTADFAKAVQVLQRYGNGNDVTLRRLFANALVLNQKAAQGRKILESLTVKEDPGRQVAKSGALARTIEYYIAEKDSQTGEQQWDNWQNQFPVDFLEGYSVALKVKLMEIKGVPQSAGRVAEAFAMAMPGSSYSPQLLSRASRLLAATDPARSEAIVKLLKDRYPEDPLSQ